MTLFQEFRVWARRAPMAERVGAAVVACASLSLIGWILVPSGSGGTPPGVQVSAASTRSGTASSTISGSADHTSSGATGALPGTAAAGTGPTSGPGGPSGLASSGGTGGTSGPTGGGGAVGATSAGCSSPPGSDQGVTAQEIRLAITLVNLVGPTTNQALGVPTPAQQQAYYTAVIDSINASGGVACRKLVATYYQVNPADSSDQQQKCLSIAQAGDFAVIDEGGYYGLSAANCFPQHQLPFVADGELDASQQSQFYPYYLGTGLLETTYRNAVLALSQRGFFGSSNGFKKLGVFYRDCFPNLVSSVLGWLSQVGVSGSKLVTYDLGCPSAYASPSDIEQAILKFQEAGVTDASEINDFFDYGNFTNLAEQQGFKPKWGLADDTVVPLTSGGSSANYSSDNMANAVAITPNRYGEQTTPGYTPSSGTAKCDQIERKAGQPPVYQSVDGIMCDQLWMLAAAIDHAPALQRTELAAGLAAARSVEFSFPFGPNDFTAPRTTTGDEYWRVDQFLTSCDCWRVVDPTFHPSL